MKTTYTIGLLLVCMLCRPTLHETIENNDQDYGDDYEEEDYDYSWDELLNEPENKSSITTTTKAPTTKSTTAFVEPVTEIFVELPSITYKCPELCSCNHDFTIINCSLQNLQHVPYSFPDVVERLDLSQNSLETIDERDFQNCTNLKQLILDNNKLVNINFKNTSWLKKLEHISLVNNHISKIDPNAFSTLIALKSLNLSNNPIEISAAIGETGNNIEDSSFLNQPNLQELNLNGCKVHGVHANMLHNISGLIALDLGNNTFDQPIDTQAFVPLKNLVTLKLPELEENIISELCKTLTAIDAISLPTYDVSCFELESGSSFDDSTIKTSSNVNSHDDKPNVQQNSVSSSDNKGPVKTSATRTEGAGGRRVDKNGEKSIDEAVQRNSTRRIRPSKAMENNRTLAEDLVNSTTISTNQHSTDPDDDEDYKVSISSQTINQILIGIIIVAVAGIIAGIICRRDFCGIKTKMCRTRRPAPTDQVRPAEEIPLNKV